MNTSKHISQDDLISNAPEGWRILLIALLQEINDIASQYHIYEGSKEYPRITHFAEVYGVLSIDFECDHDSLKADVLALINKCYQYSNHTCSKCGHQKSVTRRQSTYENT